MAERPAVRAPYPGLRPFERHEAQIFFGREQHVDRLLEILQREHFLAVIGPSGSGKSSLVRAGLLSALAAGWLATGSNWRMAVLHPGDRPHRNLALALLDPTVLGPALASGDDESSDVALIHAELNRGPLGLVHLVNDAVQSGRVAETTQLLVLVDQFEEIFRYGRLGHAQADEADAFVSLLLAARAKGEGRIFVVLTMRTDFLGNCVQFLELPDAINRAQYLTPRLTRGQLESAITGPARIFGGDVAPDIVNELINTVAEDPDQLPILQHALARMWEEAKRIAPDEPVISRTVLGHIDGISMALSRHADAVLDGLSETVLDARALTETLFRSITERSETDGRDTRRPERLGLIADAGGRRWQDLVPVVEAYAQEGVNFLVHGRPLDGAAFVDISHEALIRQWKLLQDWVADEAERADGYRRWRGRALDWSEHRGELLTGADLARALEWRAGTAAWQPTPEWARRYAADESAPAHEFDTTLSYIGEGEQRERAQREATEAAVRERAAAAIREQELAVASARKSRRLSMIVGVIALLAIAAAGWAIVSFRNASQATATALKAQEAALRAEGQALEARNQAQEGQKRTEIALDEVRTEKKNAEDANARAKAERIRADDKARLAQAQALEAHARLTFGQFNQTGAGLELSFLLATESLRAAWTYDGYDAWAKAAKIFPVRQAVRSIPGGRLSAMSVSPDGRWVATGAPTGSITIRNAEDWSEVKVLPLRRNDAEVIEFSPDSRWLAAGQGDEVRLWRTSDWQQTDSVNRPWRAWGALVFNHSGTLLATATGEMLARVFPVNTDGKLGAEIRRPEFEGPGRITAVAFAPDGAWFALGGENPGVRVYFARPGLDLWKDVFADANQTPELRWIDTREPTLVISSLKNQQREQILIGTNKGVARSTNPTVASNASNAFGPSVDSTGPVRGISPGPTGDWYATASADGSVHVRNDWGGDIAITPPAPTLVDGRTSLGFVRAGNRLVTGSANGSVTFWSLWPSPFSAQVSLAARTSALAATPDGKWLAVGDENRAIQVLATPAMREVTRWSHPDGVLSLAFSRDGRWLAVGDFKGVQLRDTRNWTPVADQRLPLMGNGLGFSPDSRWLVAIGYEAVRILPIPSLSGARVVPFPGIADGLAFSPDGRFVAIRTAPPIQGSTPTPPQPTVTRIVDLGTGKAIAWKSHEKELDGQLSRPAGQEPPALQGERADVLAASARWPWSSLYQLRAKSDDGRWELVGWSLRDARGRQHISFDSLDRAVFLDGGRWLVTSQATSQAGFVGLLPLGTEDIRRESCRRLTRNLRREDWAQYVGGNYERTCPDLPIP